MQQSKFNPIIIIPARMGATRFPGKPLKLINDLPMVIKILKQAESTKLAKVLVAAGDQEIYDCVKEYGGEAILTDPNLPSGTDRVAAAIDLFDPSHNYNIIVNLQGDLAVFENEVIESSLLGLKNNPEYDISTVCTLIKEKRLINDPNTVKAVIAFTEANKYGTGLYFTRSTCPSGEGNLYQHLGVYAYKREALQKFVTLPVSELETRERLEQLRGLEAGLKFIVNVVNSAPLEVNTPEDLEYISKHTKN
ncbi:3-deoxy-manno-octulosonate cytidylyltransferase [Rickettsiales bacterium LUAb2]